MRWMQWLSDAGQDLRFAGRMFRKQPGFALVAVLTLAVGIGANTAMFSLADASLLHPLPFPDPDRLVSVNEIVPLVGQRPIRLTAPDLVDFEEQGRAFDALGGWSSRTFELSGARASERVQAVRATAGFFSVLQVGPALGRVFTRDEDRGGAPVCVISDGLAGRWFGGAAGAVGRTVRLDRVPYKIVGVMPRRFEFPSRGTLDSAQPVDVWVPMSLTPIERAARGDGWNYTGIARLKPGVTVAQATADVDRIAQHIVRDLMPPDRAGFMKFDALVRPLAPQLTGGVRPLVVTLIGAVALVLLIACVNVANLLLARGAARHREIAMRVALGAGRGRILRQLLVEALLIAALAAGGGLLLALWITDAVARAAPGRFAIFGQAQIDGRVLLFAIGVAAATAILVGLVPGLTATHAGPVGVADGRSTAGVPHRRVRSALVVVEIALALMLLVGAGLLARSFYDLVNDRAGFEPAGAVAGYVSLPPLDYPGKVRERQFYDGILDRLRTVPGVQAVGIGSNLPLNGPRMERAFYPDGYPAAAKARFNIVGMTTVDGEYLQAIGATLLRGRYFDARDSAGAAPAAILTDSVAQRYWPGQDPVGKRLKWGIAQSPSAWFTVVGVVADVRGAIDDPTSLQIFIPSDQAELSIVSDPSGQFVDQLLRSVFVVVRGRGASGALLGDLRRAVHDADPHLAIASLRSLEDTVAASAAPQRFNMMMMLAFAVVAATLAAIGIYGVVAYSVTQRTQEIGIRMALGADAASVRRMILRDGVGVALVGIVAGTVATAAVAPAIRALLFGVAPLDPATFAAVAVLLLGVAAVATYLPARRAIRIDPLTALRAE